jgi:L-alanine-DL-glutamate epimerase-like enolase superfamily enzyme
VELEEWPLASPFRTAAHTLTALEVVRVTLESEGRVGQGEAAGVYYRNDTPRTIRTQLEAMRRRIENGLSRSTLQQMLPPGGARNALDCALWDLQAKLSGRPAWQDAGLDAPRPLVTTFTCGAEAPEQMAARALSYGNVRAIKLKLTGEPADADRVRAVRDVLPGVWLAVDANQGFTSEGLERLMPTLVASRVELIEQPFPAGQDTALGSICSPIPIAADESVQTRADMPALVGRYSVINIKLDKCGGLTEGLAMAHEARRLGLETMVGNMLGTSLAMGPAFLVGQLCRVVDLDGPIYLRGDRSAAVEYEHGLIRCPDIVWG